MKDDLEKVEKGVRSPNQEAIAPVQLKAGEGLNQGCGHVTGEKGKDARNAMDAENSRLSNCQEILI